MSAGLVYVGTTRFGRAPAGFALVNVVACVLWLGVGFMLAYRSYRTASRSRDGWKQLKSVETQEALAIDHVSLGQGWNSMAGNGSAQGDV